MSYTNDRASADLNKAAAHDTSLYDESRHDNHIVAMYDTDAQAVAARTALTNAGVSAASIQTVSLGADPGTLGGVNAEDRDNSFWSVLGSLFGAETDRNAYSHAVGRGHAMLVITPAQGVDRTALVRAIDATHPVDFDARLEEWRQAGYDHSTPHPEYAASMPPAMDSPVAAMADNDPVVQGIAPAPRQSNSTVSPVGTGQNALRDPATGLPRGQSNL